MKKSIRKASKYITTTANLVKIFEFFKNIYDSHSTAVAILFILSLCATAASYVVQILQGITPLIASILSLLLFLSLILITMIYYRPRQPLQPPKRNNLDSDARSQAAIKFKTDLDQRAALTRSAYTGQNIRVTKVLKGISLSTSENTRNNDPKLSVVIENNSPQPMRNFEVWVDNIKFWSVKQQSFVGRSDLDKKVRLHSRTVLDPDTPERVFLLTNSEHGLIILNHGDSNHNRPQPFFITIPGIYRVGILIKSYPAESTHFVYVRYDHDKLPQFTEHPDKFLTSTP